MKKNYLLLIVCLCFVGCIQTNDFLEDSIVTRANTLSLESSVHNGFTNIDYIEVNGHSPLKTGIMKGRIYTENGAIYTFRIASQGGTIATVGFRNSITGYIPCGVNKIVNLKLMPGWNFFQLEVVLKATNISINARVLIEKVDGISFSNGTDYCDLSVYVTNVGMTPGQPNTGGSNPAHWVCKACGSINWQTNTHCMCGAEKEK